MSNSYGYYPDLFDMTSQPKHPMKGHRYTWLNQSSPALYTGTTDTQPKLHKFIDTNKQRYELLENELRDLKEEK